MSRKQSLQEMLRALPKPAPRNDWNRGRPGTLAPDDGFPAYDPRDFESDHGSKGGSDEEEDEEEEEAGDGAAGGAYAVLAALEGADDGDDGWATVGSKQKRKTPAAQQASQGRAQATAGGQGHTAQRAQQQQQQRAQQQQQQQLQRSPGPAAPRGPRPVTHDEQGKPLTDDYYKTFQKAYRNPQTGMCCLRFHKTDIIAVAPTGDVTVTSGGYRTRTTFQSLREGLAPLGIKLASQGYEGNGAWYVQLPDGTSLDFQDGLVIRAAGPGDMRRGAALLSALAGPDGGAAAAVRVASGAGPSTSTGSTARLAPHAGQQRTGPSTAPVYAYHPTAARPVYTPQGMQYAPAGAPSPSTSSQAAASTSAYRGAAAAGPSGAGTSSSAQHKPAVDMNRLFTDALALHEADEPLDDEHACILCMGALRSTILVPCGHMILCDTCSKDVMGRTAECPMCRTKVTQVVTVA